MHGDFVPGYPEFDPNAEAAAVPMVGVGGLNHHTATHDPVANVHKLGHFRLHPLSHGG